MGIKKIDQRASVSIRLGDEFKRTLAALKIQDKKLPGKFKRQLRQSVKPVIQKVKASALAIETHGKTHTGLRKRVSRGVHLKISAGGSAVRIATKMANPAEAALPRGLEFPKGWVHPVFASADEPRNQWTWTREPGREWFFEPIEESADDIERSMADVLDDAIDAIDKGI